MCVMIIKENELMHNYTPTILMNYLTIISGIDMYHVEFTGKRLKISLFSGCLRVLFLKIIFK